MFPERSKEIPCCGGKSGPMEQERVGADRGTGADQEKNQHHDAADAAGEFGEATA